MKNTTFIGAGSVKVSRVVHSQTDGILTFSEAKIYLEDVNIQRAKMDAKMGKSEIPTRPNASTLIELTLDGSEIPPFD
jgi:alpha-galactosidase/6-phospho-beta-glucosidase family protein